METKLFKKMEKITTPKDLPVGTKVIMVGVDQDSKANDDSTLEWEYGTVVKSGRKYVYIARENEENYPPRLQFFWTEIDFQYGFDNYIKNHNGKHIRVFKNWYMRERFLKRKELGGIIHEFRKDGWLFNDLSSDYIFNEGKGADERVSDETLEALAEAIKMFNLDYYRKDM